jgi:hypothetical protein
MQRPLDQTELLTEIASVADRLDRAELSREERLALLRRQAQLGDLRDAIRERERRARDR